MCSIAAIAEFDSLVKELIPESEANPSMGVYVVKLCKDGEWKKILMDAFVHIEYSKKKRDPERVNNRFADCRCTQQIF